MGIKRLLGRKSPKSGNADAEIILKKSYAQEGEDLILERLFYMVDDGFFVDVGAHHPTRFSNTYLFYEKGWRGINIDALPGTKKIFDEQRSEDINIEQGVSAKEGQLTYFMFNDPALNTFDPDEASAKDGINNGDYYLIDKKEIITAPLSQILSQHVKEGQVIDFLSIDVEGLDEEVLRSNDWDMFRPKVVLVEELQMDIEKIISSSSVYRFMQEKGYTLWARTLNTSFYVKKD